MAVRGNLPSRFSVFESPDFLKQVPTGFNETVSKQMASNVGKYTISGAPAEWAEFCGAAFNSVLVGVKTPKQALEELETKINESLKEFKP
jgi:ABC-type glycerol-3-phosphate transport system substrate-binding protein